MNRPKHITLEWSRWITINGTDHRDIDPSEYTGSVVFQRHGSTATETGECGQDGISCRGAKVPDVWRWKPAPVDLPNLELVDSDTGP